MAATTFQAVLSLSGYGSLVQVPLGRGQNHAAQTPNLSPRAFHYPHSCSRARESMRTTLKEKGTQLWIIDSLMEFISDFNSDQVVNNLLIPLAALARDAIKAGHAAGHSDGQLKDARHSPQIENAKGDLDGWVYGGRR